MPTEEIIMVTSIEKRSVSERERERGGGERERVLERERERDREREGEREKERDREREKERERVRWRDGVVIRPCMPNATFNRHLLNTYSIYGNYAINSKQRKLLPT